MFQKDLDQNDIDAMEREAMYAGADRLHVRFFKQAVRITDASVPERIPDPSDPEGVKTIQVDGARQEAKEGRPLYRDEHWIEIMIPGDQLTNVRRPVRNMDVQLYGAKWEAYLKGESQPETGTPLDVLPFLTRSQVAEFKAMNLHTAEQLVGMPDSAKNRFMGVSHVIKRVSDFLAAAAKNAPIAQMRHELDSRDTVIADLKRRLTELEQAKAQSQAPKGK